MQKAKDEVSRLLERLPDNSSLEDIQYHLLVLQKIERGLNDAKEGRVFSQDEIEKMAQRWTKK